MQLHVRHFFLPTILLILSALITEAQSFSKELSLPEGTTVSVINRYGRIDVEAVAVEPGSTDRKAQITATSDKKQVTPKEVAISTKGRHVDIEIKPADPQKRIDVSLKLPERSLLSAETLDGALMVTGDLALIDTTTVTGTVAVDIPINDLKYDLTWTESHPR